MLEKIRVAVDRETGSILERIAGGIKETLDERPFWSRDFVKELGTNIQAIWSKKPEWVEAAVEDAALSAVKTISGQVGTELQKVREAGDGVATRIGHLELTTANLASSVKLVGDGVDLARQEMAGAAAAAARSFIDIDSVLAALREAGPRDIARIEALLTQQQQVVSQLATDVGEQGLQLKQCREALERLGRPWWKKVFGG